MFQPKEVASHTTMSLVMLVMLLPQAFLLFASVCCLEHVFIMFLIRQFTL